MKIQKIFLLLSLMLFSGVVYGETKIGTYKMSYFGDKEYNVCVGTKPTFFIFYTESKDSYVTSFSISHDEFDSFLNPLKTARNKFEEWCQVAKDNNVENVRKMLEPQTAQLGCSFWDGVNNIYGYGGQHQPDLEFIIEDSKPMIRLHMGSYSDIKGHKCLGFYLVFISVEEMDAFISWFDVEKATIILEQQQSVKDLFN